VEYDPFIKIQLASRTYISGPYVMQIWSRNTPESGPNETFVLRRAGGYRVTSLIRNTPLLAPYIRTIPRVQWWLWGEGLFLMSEVPL